MFGQEVLYDMRRTAEETWTGSANNPELTVAPTLEP